MSLPSPWRHPLLYDEIKKLEKILTEFLEAAKGAPQRPSYQYAQIFVALLRNQIVFQEHMQEVERFHAKMLRSKGFLEMLK